MRRMSLSCTSSIPGAVPLAQGDLGARVAVAVAAEVDAAEVETVAVETVVVETVEVVELKARRLLRFDKN